MRYVGAKITPADILPNLNKCIVHILDLNINLTKEYLLSAWNAKSIGSQDFYLAYIKDDNQLLNLNFSEIFDFRRIAIIESSKVRTAYKIEKRK